MPDPRMPDAPPRSDDWRKPRPRLTLWIEDKLDHGWGWFGWSRDPVGYGVALTISGFVLINGVLRVVLDEPRLALLGASLVVAAALAWQHARLVRARLLLVRRIAGLCLNCGYDLRASPTRCPECGREREVPPARIRTLPSTVAPMWLEVGHGPIAED